MDNCFELRGTHEKGGGAFATRPFQTDEAVMVGVINRELDRNRSHVSQVSAERFVSHSGLISKVNHSCEPNCGSASVSVMPTALPTTHPSPRATRTLLTMRRRSTRSTNSPLAAGAAHPAAVAVSPAGVISGPALSGLPRLGRPLPHLDRPRLIGPWPHAETVVGNPPGRAV